VEFLAGNSLNVTPPERGDLLVAEIIGIDPLAEGMLEVTLDARRRLLKEGGRMIPRRIDIFAAAVESPHVDMMAENRKNHLDGLKYFHSLFGIRVRPLTDRLGIEPLPPLTADLSAAAEERRARKTAFLSEGVLLEEVDLTTFERAEAAGERAFTATKDGRLNAAALYFVAHLSAEVILGTAPGMEYPVSWGGQTIFPLEKAVAVREGQEIRFEYYAGPLTQGRLKVMLRS
jgi:protein arginine N-methyltransferase 1